MILNCLFYLILVLIGSNATEHTYEELSKFPTLFYLDNYEKCLAKKTGVYCIGTFEVTPEKTPHLMYESMQRRTKRFFAFNRTLIHRGYCVSERCNLKQGNTTLDFEKCVARYASRYAFNTRAKTTSCTTYLQLKNKAEKVPDFAQRIFVYVVSFIVFLNVIGTYYDKNSGEKKNKLLTAWSISANWERLTQTSNDTLSPLQGFRTLMQWIIIFAHSAMLQYMAYVHNPDEMEDFHKGTVGSLLRNGTSAVQTFVIISGFLTAYNMLSYSQKFPISIKLIGKWILKRYTRILPVFMLVAGYGATWWPKFSSGPMWSIVESESAICRKKFWTYPLFMNNLVYSNEHCMIQAWSIAVDMQLYVLSLIVTVILLKMRKKAIGIIAVMFIASSALNVILSYVNGWVPMVKIISPENIRHVFIDSPTLVNLHMSPWGNLPACLLGLLTAHVLTQIQAKKVKVEDEPEKEGDRKEKKERAVMRFLRRIVTKYTDVFCAVGIVTWVILGTRLDDIDSKIISALYVGMERLVFSVLFATGMIHVATHNGYFRMIFGWSGWYVLGKLSFSLAMVHWCVNATIVGVKPQPISSSVFHGSLDWLATLFYSYLVAVPVSLLVEFPMQKTLDALLS